MKERVKAYKRLKALQRVDEALEKLPETPRTTLSRSLAVYLPLLPTP